MSLFRLDASIRVEGSASREIADIVEAGWVAGSPSASVVRRHVGTEPVPATAWAAAVAGSALPAAERSPEQAQAVALAATLTDELLEADGLLFAVPLYNFGVSQHVKTWIDLALAGAPLGTRLLEGTPTVLITTRGGAYGPGTPREGWDHNVDYLRRILVDVWGAELTLVEREFTLVGVNPALDEFTEVAALLHKGAEEAAAEAGSALAAKHAA